MAAHTATRMTVCNFKMFSFSCCVWMAETADLRVRDGATRMIRDNPSHRRKSAVLAASVFLVFKYSAAILVATFLPGVSNVIAPLAI